MQVDLPELLAIDARTVFRASRVVAVGDEQQRFPGGLETTHDPARPVKDRPESQDYEQFLRSTFALMVEAQGHALHVAHIIAGEFLLKP